MKQVKVLLGKVHSFYQNTWMFGAILAILMAGGWYFYAGIKQVILQFCLWMIVFMTLGAVAHYFDRNK